MKNTPTILERRTLLEPRLIAGMALVAVMSFGIGVLIVEWILPAVIVGTGF